MSDFLKSRARQPKLYIDLPSYGKFYGDGVVQDNTFSNLAVYGMNAMDEIMLKTPDALFTGESTASIIKSCVPSILDPWQLVGYDIDHVLLSIRIATYGDKMPVVSSCTKCGAQNNGETNLNKVLETFLSLPIENTVVLQDLQLNLKPLSYRQMTDFSHKQYALEKQLIQIAKQNKDDAESDKQKQDILAQLTNLNLEIAITYVDSITEINSKESESDITKIREFLINNDAEFFNVLTDKVRSMSKAWSLPEFDIKCSDENCNHEYKTKLKVDYASFFGSNSFRSRNLMS